MMVKGVNRQIIEINDTGNNYFEKALLFVAPGRSDTPNAKLKAEAKHYLLSLSKAQEPKTLRQRHKIKMRKKHLIVISSAVAFAAAVAVLLLNFL